MGKGKINNEPDSEIKKVARLTLGKYTTKPKKTRREKNIIK